MAKLAVNGPFDKRDLHDHLGAYPVRADARQADGLRERRRRDFKAPEPLAEVQQQLRVEAGADLPGEHEVVSLEVADEQRAEPDPAPVVASSSVSAASSSPTVSVGSAAGEGRTAATPA